MIELYKNIALRQKGYKKTTENIINKFEILINKYS